MPLEKISLDSILGLTTERDDTSGINSPQWSSMAAWAVENASSGATNPNTLLDCENIIISRNKQAAARTAFAEVWDFTVPGSPEIIYGSVSTFMTTGLYAIPNSSAIFNSLQFGWISTTAINSFLANIGNFSDSVDQQMDSTVNIIGSNAASATTYAAFSGLLNLLPDFSWSASTTPEFPIKSFNIARFSTSYSNIYVFSSNGVFRTIQGYIANVTASNYNKYKRVTLPVVLNLSAQITAAPADAARWFPSGMLVDIQIVVSDQLSSTQVYQGKPSRTLTVQNISTLSSIQITFSVDNTNIFLNSGGIGIYRTTAYAAGTSPSTNFYKCYEASLNAGSTTGHVTTFTNIELTLNDTSISQFEQIYTSLNNESVGTATLVQSAETSAPPTARDVCLYNNFTVYGNIMCPPFAVLTMTALPNTDGLDKLTVGATTVDITYVPNSTVPPTNNGVIDNVTGTFAGINSSPNSGKGYNLVIRPQDPTVDSPGVAATYSVPFYALAEKLVLSTGSGSTQDINITPQPGAVFDIGQFPATGIIAVIQSTTTGNVIALFTYQSYTQDPSAGYYVFSNCLAFGVPFTDATWTAILPATGSITGPFVLYALFGTAVTALSVYAIGSDATGYDSEVGFSLLATYELYSTRKFNQNFVGVVTSVTQNGSSTSTVASPVLASINFLGNYAQNSGQLLDQCVKTLCDTYNTARTPEDPYAVYNDSATAPAGQIRFESLYSGYNRNSTYTSNPLYTFGNGYYDSVFAVVSRTDLTQPTVKFAEPINVSYTGHIEPPANIMQQSVQTISGLTVSKFNKPEEIPIGQNLTPYLIGDPLRPIIKLVNQYNQLYIFKENEGTYRTDFSPAGPAGALPSINTLTLVDNTAWLLLPESVQVFEGTIVYFSNKAFVTISSSGQLSQISPTIETELLNAYATIYANGDTDNVRSWVITQQRLYCCFFPNINLDNTSETYVFSFNTGQWTKWSGEINDAVVSATGELTTVQNIYEFDSVITDQNALDTASINPAVKYWSVIRQANFQNPSTTQIEDIIPLTTLTLTPVITPTSALVIISGFNSTGVYGNIYDILMLYRNRTIWYFSQTLGYFSTILVAADPGVSVSLQLVNNIYSQTAITPSGFVPTTADFLVTTVNTQIFFNRFFIATPRGSTISHFNEVQVYTQDGEEYSNLAIGFNSLEPTSPYVYTNPPPLLQIVTTNGDFVVLNTSIFDIFSPYYVFAPSQYTFRALVPLSAGRGRFIQISLLHDTPNEVFKLNSVVYIYRDTTSTKIKAHSS